MDELIRAEHLTKHFRAAGSSMWEKELFAAVDDVSFSVFEGETLGLLGESGCGKSTIARMLLGLARPTDGAIYYKWEDVTGKIGNYRKEIQMIFQNPFASLDPRMKIKDSLMEPLKQWKIENTKEERMERILGICRECGLEDDTLEKRPHEFSGGQLQRISIARALLVEPKFLVADEIVSALDVSVQNQVLSLLEKMKEKHGLTILFITHDLPVIRKLCDRVMVMRAGRLIDCGPCDEIMDSPRNEYVSELKQAAFPLYGGLKK